MAAARAAAGVALLAGLCAATAASAAETYSYTVHHPSFGDIGTYTERVDRRGGETRIDTTVHVVVRALGVVLHREDAERTELWRDERLVGFQGVTMVNGKPLEVRGEATADGFAVSSPDGTAVGPADLIPADPWQLGHVAGSVNLPIGGTLMSTRGGELYPFQVTGGEPMQLAVQGVEVPVRHYTVSSRKHQEVWVAHGVPVAFRSVESGTPIDFTLSREGIAATVASSD